MSQSHSGHLLELLHLEHAGQEAPGGRPDDDGVLRGLVQEERGVSDGDSVHTELGDGATADGGDCEATSHSDLKIHCQRRTEV